MFSTEAWPVGRNPRNSGICHQSLLTYKGKGGGKSSLSLKNFFHTKIDPFAKHFLSQEAPPPISLETEGEALGWLRHSRTP